MGGEWRFYAPTRILYGPGVSSQVGVQSREFGLHHPLVATDRSLALAGHVEKVRQALRDEGLEPVVYDGISHEPTVASVEDVAEVARLERCDAVIGLGGGSCLDAAKAVAVLLTNDGGLDEYLTGRPIERCPLPIMGIPTTFGSGSEVTNIAVVGNPERGYKKGLKNDFFYPAVALVDPELGESMPRALTASCGMDAFAHALEAYTSVAATPVSEAMALQALVLIYGAMRCLADNGESRAMLSALALGSTLAGMSFANSSTGLAHALAERVATVRGAGHGELVALMLPSVMRFNLPRARSKYGEVARSIGLAPRGAAKTPEEGLPDAVQTLCSELGMNTHLSGYGLADEDLVNLAREPIGGTSMLLNVRRADQEDVLRIYREML